MTSTKPSAHLRSAAKKLAPAPLNLGAISSQVEESQAGSVLQHPPATVNTDGLYKTITKLFGSYMKGGKGSSIPSSIYNLILFYVNHSILLVMFFFISIYRNIQKIYRRVVLKFLTLAYYPNKSPQLIRDDVNKLTKIPRRISCILDLKDEGEENGGIDGLINNISEISAWAISAGIPTLNVYEYNGVINNHLPELIRYISKNLSVYFGTDSIPVFSAKVPHSNLLVYSTNPLDDPSTPRPDHVDLEISLLSRVDGKPTIIELTKTMSELAVNNELSIKDITIDLIDEELVELVGFEPDLLIYFGPSLDLQDYPPWHIRLSEIYWEPDNKDVNYAVFIRALQKYSNCKVNVGK